LHSDFIPKHKPSIRALYKSQLDAMLGALEREMPKTVTWNKPIGGMFLWLTLPKHIQSQALLHKVVEQGVAFVPGAAFYANEGEMEHNKLRLSFGADQQGYCDSCQVHRCRRLTVRYEPRI
jgi:2-aminoadipate transaminase